MNFAESNFWLSLGVGLLVSLFLVVTVGRVIPGKRVEIEKLSFSCISLFLLYQESFLTMLAFLWVVLLGWLGVKCYDSENKKSRWFVVGWYALIAAQLVPLFYFKYWQFVIESIFGWEVDLPHTLIPMGLSFYSFQVVSMCLDSKKEGLPPPRFIDYFNFASFFPQIVAGPIERRRDLLPQIQNLRLKISRTALEQAIPWIVMGLFYKMVLADNLALLDGSSRFDPANGFHVISEIILFSFRIYFDFAGYSFVALGLGALFGVTLTLNFKAPYWSLNLQDFWRKWHITLSQWLRDYIYFALGGSRRGVVWINLLVTFVVSGVWHGAGWNFILWGLLHGLGLVICNSSQGLKMPRFFSWLITIVFVFFTWLFFFETNTALLFQKVETLFSLGSYSQESLRGGLGFVAERATLVFLAAIMGLSAIVLLMEGIGQRQSAPYRFLMSLPACAVMVVLLVLLPPVEPSTFIYFNF